MKPDGFDVLFRAIAIEALAFGHSTPILRGDESTYWYFTGLATGHRYGYEFGYKQRYLDELQERLLNLTLAEAQGRVMH